MRPFCFGAANAARTSVARAACIKPRLRGFNGIDSARDSVAREACIRACEARPYWSRFQVTVLSNYKV